MKDDYKELIKLTGDVVRAAGGAIRISVIRNRGEATGADPDAALWGPTDAPEGARRFELRPVTMFSKRFIVHCGGAVLGDLTLGGAKGVKARLVLGDEVYEVRKDPRDGALLLERQGLPEAQAIKTSVWKHAYDVEWPDGRLRFGRPAGDERTFEAEADGQRVALVHKPTFFSRRVEADVPEAWPIPFALFLAALALNAWDDT